MWIDSFHYAGNESVVCHVINGLINFVIVGYNGSPLFRIMRVFVLIAINDQNFTMSYDFEDALCVIRQSFE